MQKEPTVHAQIVATIDRYAHLRENGQTSSARTRDLTRAVIHKAFKDLHALGFHIQNIDNLSAKHISALVRHWHASGKANSTMQNDLSRLRIFAGWIDKPGLVKDVPYYLQGIADPATLKVKVNAEASKGWSSNGVDLAGKVRQAERLDENFGLMLMMQFAFGLRREEAIKCRPWKADQGDYLKVFPGEGKNGRERSIPIATTQQRAVLDYVKSRIGKTKALGWELTRDGKVATLKQNLKRYSNLMTTVGITKEQAGVTGHGLRAQFAENLALLERFIPPTLGGNRQHASEEDLLNGRMTVSEALGHGEISITGAYYGKFSRKDRVATGASHAEIIASGLELLTPAQLEEDIPVERRNHIARISFILADQRISLTPHQVHALWRIHSRRHAQAWSEPADGVLEGITVAAWQLVQDAERAARAQQSLPLASEPETSA